LTRLMKKISNQRELAGWFCHAASRRDFLHPPRQLSGEMKSWKNRIVNLIDENAEQSSNKVDLVTASLVEIASILATLHGTPRLGNPTDPVDDLIYIILARKTREDAYQKTYEALKKRFPDWNALLRARRSTVEKIVSSGGLVARKTDSIFGALGKIRDEFGAVTLESLRDLPDDEVEAFLCSLPEISRKSAYCVMMYTLDRRVLPADTHVGRVFSRLEPFLDLGISLDGLDHKKLQLRLADLVPPPLRYSLHVNLIEHGRKVCLPRKPRCQECELTAFCHRYRSERAELAATSTSPVAIDLFSGAGGLSDGLGQAGFRIGLAVDMDPVALRTYRHNHPAVAGDRVLCTDASTLDARAFRRLMKGTRVDLVAGSPPCQGFSTTGMRSKVSKTGYRADQDGRNWLFEVMVTAVEALKPRVILLENVPGMGSTRSGKKSFMEIAAGCFEESGYRTTTWKLNAASFGVPQDRIRTFLIGWKGQTAPAPPEEEYQNWKSAGFDPDALPPVTLSEAISDLPALKAGDGEPIIPFSGDETPERTWRRYLGKFGIGRRGPILYNHTVRPNNERDLELFAILRPGEDSIHAVERHGRSDLMRYRTDAFDDKYARLRGDLPSRTIVSHLSKDGNGFIHPEQVRSISVREAARLQSFRDDYVFCGTASDQYHQVGNAVPPLLAREIGRSLLDSISR